MQAVPPAPLHATPACTLLQAPSACTFSYIRVVHEVQLLQRSIRAQRCRQRLDSAGLQPRTTDPKAVQAAAAGHDLQAGAGLRRDTSALGIVV